MPEMMRLEVTGDEKIAAKLDYLADNTQRKVVRPAANYAWTPVNKDAKSTVPQDTGTLKKSIGKKGKTYSASGVVWVGVGARKDPKYIGPDGRKPWKYAHIVEHGTVNRAPQPFMRTAFNRQKANAERRLYQKTWQRLQMELAKL